MADEFEIGVIGDLSGGAVQKPDRFLELDREAFTESFARLRPAVEPGLPFCERLELRDWDDWHPDGLLERVPLLARLLEARDAAGDATRMRKALDQAGVSIQAPAPAAEEAEAPPAPAASGAALLDELLDGSPAPGATARAARHVADPAFEALLAEIAAPHAERIDHAGIAARRQAIDAELGARTRSLLRHPAFRAREALWRSLRSLVFGSEIGEGLRVRVLDAGCEALAGDDAGPLAEALYRLVVTDEHGTAGGRPFGLLLVDATLEGGDADLALLAHLGRIAGEARVPCLLSAGRGLWEPGRAEAAGRFLERARALPGAERIALCAPRLLVRIPYGRSGDPVEGFAFEEVDEETGASGYCLGAGGFAVAQAAAEAVAATGEPAQTARFAQREGLPFHPRSGGDAFGPTEQVLPDSELERLRGLGLLPIAGVRGRDTAVIVSLDTLTGAHLFA